MNFPFVRLTGTAIFAASLLSCGPALAWSQPGHMLTAAIAFDDLSVRDRAAVDTLADIIRAIRIAGRSRSRSTARRDRSARFA